LVSKVTLFLLLATYLPKIESNYSQILTTSPGGSSVNKAERKSLKRKATSILLRDVQANKLNLTKLKSTNPLKAALNTRSNSLPFESIKRTTMEPYRIPALAHAKGVKVSYFSSRNLRILKPILVPERIQSYLISQGIILNEEKLIDTSIKMLLDGKLELSVALDESTINLLQHEKLFQLLSTSNNKAIFERVKRIIEKTEELDKVPLLNKLKERVNEKASQKDNKYLITAFACFKQLLNEFEGVSKEHVDLLLRVFRRLLEESERNWKRSLDLLADCIGNLEVKLNTLRSTLKPEAQAILDKLMISQEEMNMNLEEELKELKNTWILHWDKLRYSDRITEKLKNLTDTVIEQTCDLDKDMGEDKRALIVNIERLIQAYPGDYLAERNKQTTLNSERNIGRMKRAAKLVTNHKEDMILMNRRRKRQEVGIQTDPYKSLLEIEIESFLKNGSRVYLFYNYT